MGALASAYRSGKALYVGISSYTAEQTRKAYAILKDMDVPLLIHQPSYSMLNRWVEPELLSTLEELGVGAICFSPLGQGMLTDKYLKEIPSTSRAAKDLSLKKSMLSKENLDKIRFLNEIAKKRNQSLAQMALAWVLRRKEVTSVLIGASSAEQIVENVAALDHLEFAADELRMIDQYATDGDINIWAKR